MPTKEIVRWDESSKRSYTIDQYILAFIGQLPNEALLSEQWEALPIITIGFDSTADTLKHIKKVNSYLIFAATEVLRRADVHDMSKLEEPEKAIFDKMTPLLASVEYGTDDYKKMLESIKPALQHHYANNSHHPEYYHGKVNGFDLFDLIEMFFDWKAASERTQNGNMEQSITVGVERFKIDPQIDRIFRNTEFRYFQK